MGVRDIVLVISYLLAVVSTNPNHEPKVYEELDETPTEHVRTARHLDGSQDIYQPPVFNFREMKQQDLLKSRYHLQQQADFRNLKIAHEMNQNMGQTRGSRMNIPARENYNGWKPFQPKFLHPARPIRPIRLNGQKKLNLSTKPKSVVDPNTLGNDLDSSGSEKKEDIEESDKQGDNRKYIYVTPNVLQNNFGLDPKTTEHILQNSAPGNEQKNSDQYQISELQQLIGQNPQFQLQGLQKLLGDAQPIVQNGNPTADEKNIPGLQIDHNGSPSLPTSDPEFESLKMQIDAVNKEREQKLLEAAQREAEAHIKAQHQAIALVQKQAEEEAYAKIAAHNQGLSTEHLANAAVAIKPVQEESDDSSPESGAQENIQEVDQNSLELQYQTSNQHEASALQAIPLEATLEHHLHDVNSRNHGARGLFYYPNEASRIQYASKVRPVYNIKEIEQNYAPVPSYAPPLVSYDTVSEHQIIPVAATSQAGLPTHTQIHLDSSSEDGTNHGSKVPHIQYDDHHQYAAKYAFGYRIIDEKHGNDFGHEEKRDGKLTKGRYFVMLPDGRKQNVEYYVDKSGYHARVKYEQVARHPYVPHQEHYNQLEPGHK